MSFLLSLLQWLEAHHVAIVIDVPDSHRRGGIVNPRSPVVRVRLGQHVIDPALGARIEAEEPAAVESGGPDLPLFVGPDFVESHARGWRNVLGDLLSLSVVLSGHAA